MQCSMPTTSCPWYRSVDKARILFPCRRFKQPLARQRRIFSWRTLHHIGCLYPFRLSLLFSDSRSFTFTACLYSCSEHHQAPIPFSRPFSVLSRTVPRLSLSPTFIFCILSIMILLLLSLFFPSALALGINCRGSAYCQYGPSSLTPNIISLFVALANNTTTICLSPPFDCGPIHDTDNYAPGAHILCLPQGYVLGGICAFTQGSVSAAGTNGKLIKQKLSELRVHGCIFCGSVPLSGNNDPNTEGILTLNYVASQTCMGVCPPTHYSAAPNGSASTYVSLNDTAANGTATV